MVSRPEERHVTLTVVILGLLLLAGLGVTAADLLGVISVYDW